MATPGPESILIQSLADSHAGIGQNIEGVGSTGAAATPTAGMPAVNGQYVSNGSISGGGLGAGTSVGVVPAESNVGTLSLSANGAYSLSLSDVAAQQLPAGTPHTESFVVQSADGSTHQLNFSVQQTPEGVTIGAPSVALPDSNGAFTNTQTATGSFPVNEPGQTPNVEHLANPGTPALGVLSISDSGHYTYSVPTSASQSINANDTRVEAFSVQSPDGSSQQISFTVHGAGQDGGLAQQAISVNVTGNTAGDGRVLPDDAALTALDASAVGFFRLPQDGAVAANANNVATGVRGGQATGVPTAPASGDGGSGVPLLAPADGGDSRAPLSQAAVLAYEGGGLPREAQVSEPGLLAPAQVPLAAANPIVVVAPAAAPAPAATLVQTPAQASALVEPAPAAPAVITDPVTPVEPTTPVPPAPVVVPNAITNAIGGTVKEDVNVVAGNLLESTGTGEITGTNAAHTSFNTTVVSAPDNIGTLTIDATGHYNYTVSNAAVQYFGGNDSKVETFTVSTVDGLTKDVQFTILGTNDPAVIGTVHPTVTEDAHITAGNLTASGIISVTDVDQHQSTFQVVVTGDPHNLGHLTLTTDGQYAYTVDNTVVQYLGAQDTKVDTFTVTSFDGTTQTEQVTIQGVNDPAIIGNPDPHDVTEIAPGLTGTLTDTGKLSISDVDQNQSSFQTIVTSATGDLGALTLAIDGTYTYSVANAAVQYLGAGDTKVDTFTVTSFDGTTKDINFTIHGVNEAAVIGDPNPSDVTEIANVLTGNLSDTGKISIADVDQNQASFQAVVTSAAGDLGALTLATDGTYTYSVANAAVQYLGASDTKVDTFTIESVDGTTKDVHFTIHGVNEAAVIGDPNPSDVTELAPGLTGTLTDTGKLSITDADQHQALFQTTITSATGDLGALTLATDGTYHYSVANAAVQYLGAGDTKVDTFTVTSVDGTTKDINFTIHGVNEAAVIGNPNPSDVTEIANVLTGNLTDIGKLSIIDVDQHQSSFQTVITATTGDLGALTLATDGTYSYSVANAAVQYLGASDTKVDTFTVTSLDGTTKDISFTIHGVNEAAVIGDPIPNTVTEIAGLLTGNLTTTGQISVSDVDQNQSSFQTQVTSAAGDLGSLALATDGTYAYSVANSVVQYLGASDSKVDTFTIKSFDGTAKDVSFTILGANVPAVIGDPHPSDVTENLGIVNGRLSDTGKISVFDPNQGQSSFQTDVSSATGDLGALTIATDGTFSYSVANSDVLYLAAGETKVDTFTIKSFDGTTKDVNFTIHGVNEAAVIGNPNPSDVTEIANVLTGNLTDTGKLSITDVDHNQSSFQSAITSATGDLGALTVATDGTYTYSVANAAVQYLGAGDTKVDTFTVTSFDGTTKDINFTIHGVNEAAVIGNPDPHDVTEIAPGLAGTLTDTGRLSITDVDQNQSSFQTSITSATGDLGALTLATDGTYSYSVANASVQYLGASDTKVDTFTVTSLDGTTKDISFTIHGVNEAAVIGDPIPNTVTEVAPGLTGTLTAAGKISVTDIDQNQAGFLIGVTTKSGDLGNLVLDKNGNYTYRVANASVQYLGANDTKVDTFTISSLDGTTKDVTFMIQGVNEAAVIGAPTVADVTESSNVANDGLLYAVGTISIVDPDQNQSSFKPTVTAAVTNDGTLALATDGHYVYSVLNMREVHLPFDATKVDTFTVTSADGTTKDVNFTIHGMNNPAVIGAPSPASVTENANPIGGNLIETGHLTVSDPDTGQSSFQTIVTAAAGDKGVLSLTTDGTYTYTVANTSVQYLGAGDTKVDTFTIKSFDGTTKDINFTIHGVNEAAVIGDANPGRVTEDLNPVNGSLVERGQLSITDIDQNQASFKTSVVAATGDKGALVLAADGTYTYSVNNASIQYLGAGDTAVDTFSVTSVDGTTKDVHFIIVGVNDPAVIGDANGMVIEDTNVFRGNLIASGTITITDPDQGQSSFKTSVVATSNDWGSLVLASDGSYTYTVANNLAALQALNSNQNHVDTFTVTSFDGTTKVETFTILGQDDGGHTAPTATGNANQSNGLDIISMNVGQQSTEFPLLSGALTGVYDNHLSTISPTYVETIGGVVVSHAQPAWVSFNASGPTLSVNPSYANADLNALDGGQTATVDINYTISDGHGAQITQSAEIVVTGLYRTPTLDVAGMSDTFSANSGLHTINLLSGAHSIDTMSVSNMTISLNGAAATTLPGTGATPLTSSTNPSFTLDTTNSAYTSLAANQQTTAVISYDVVEQYGKSVHQTETLTINGSANTPAGGTIVGTPSVDLLHGTAAATTLVGGAGADVLTSGTGPTTFKYVNLADSPTSSTVPTDTINHFSTANGDKVDLTSVLSNAATVQSTISLDQTGHDSTALAVNVGGTTYHVATVTGQELSVPDALASPASGTSLSTALHDASWTTIVDIAGSANGPSSVTAAASLGASASVSGATTNASGNWTAVITSGTGAVDTTAHQIDFSTPATSNAVAITTADTATHDISNVTVVQWHA